MEIVIFFLAVIAYSLGMYWTHRLNTLCIKRGLLHFGARGEKDHHKNLNTGAPWWIHLIVAVLCGLPFSLIAMDWPPIAGAIAVAMYDRGWHHLDHINYHHRRHVGHNFGLGPGCIWDHVFKTWRDPA